MSEYDDQAAKFLADTKSTISIELAEHQTPPLWQGPDDTAAHGRLYRVTLTSPRGAYTFDFWNSIAAAEKLAALETLRDKRSIRSELPAEFRAEDLLQRELGRRVGFIRVRRDFDALAAELEVHPSAYSVLACLSMMYADNFAEFCDEFGYSTDSITAAKVYDGCKEQDRNIRRLYDHAEIELLEAIQ